MSKTLEYLKSKRQEFIKYKNQFSDEIMKLDEAIAEIREAMKPKTCDSCTQDYNERIYGDLTICDFCLRGNAADKFKPKDNA